MNNDKPPLLSIASVSAMALAYEILLMRLFSIIQWHHYAYMVISLALLGYGISGAVISISQQRLLKHFPVVYLLNFYLFGFSSVTCFLLVQQVPFNPQEMLWDARQLLNLSLSYLFLSLPFFFAANVVALAMLRYRTLISRIYAYDLIGAGLGSVFIIMLLFVLMPSNALYLLGSLALLVSVLASWEIVPGSQSIYSWLKQRNTLVVLIMVTFSLAYWSVTRSGLQLSPYKGLSQILRISGSQVIGEYTSPLGLLTLVENPTIPFRHVPGLSLHATREPPPQLGVFTDGDGMTAITQLSGSISRLTYLGQISSALPYQLNKPSQVLILGAATGSDVLQALLYKVPSIAAVELNPQLIKLVREDYAVYAGNIYNRPDVEVHNADARGFISASQDYYDLIQLAMLDNFASSGSGIYTLHENYLYTVEAIKLYLQHLSSTGYLALSRWLSLPPRDSLKLFATAIEALRASGVDKPAQHLLMIRSWQTITLLVAKQAVKRDEIKALKQFCERNGFDVVYYPAIQQAETNRYNRLKQDDFFTGSQALLGDKAEDFIKHYKFNLQPVTDDRPYFFNYFRWSSLPEIFRLRGKGGLPLLEAGYLILIAVLVQAILASVLLILPPNWLLLRRKRSSRRLIGHGRVVIYFSAIGLAFLFIEIGFIQKFILFLNHPLYAASVVLGSVLVFAGLGSGWSKRKLDNMAAKKLTAYAISAIAMISLACLLLFNSLFAQLVVLAMGIKLAITIACIAPLAFCMGIPFPAALSRLGELAPEYIPWAWGINGCASVLSAVLATLIAIHAGFSVLILSAVLLYILAYYHFPAIQDG